ncbi:MAG: hypothetical protein JOZ78_25090 [Chroococcidiopsidaceae cyanobacterium CP_BM_ER_R8_30]|nr:hypothetical protein [Chroococcidiopsidaceae cyanobacterium CP_BM_ER_R8_30]
MGSNHHHFWIKSWIPILAVLNLALVFFDLTYLSARSLYLQMMPSLVQAYDPVKGIHPHPETQRYLETVAIFESQVAQTGVESLEAQASLAKLRSYSKLLIQDNPFSKNDNAILETIKQNLRSRTGAKSSFVAFDRFWSQDYLAQTDWQSEIEFWNKQIRPLMDANYYRQVNRFGYTVNYFWLIDLPFIIIFAVDFVIQNRAIRRDHPELSWLESALRRWYDLFLLIPIWRWLRVIPVTIRLNQVGLLNLRPLEAEARRDFAIGFAKKLTEVVGIQAIDQIQAAIRRGDVMQWLLYPELGRDYVQVNDRNEIKTIITRIADIVIYQVLPQIQPELEIFIHYTLQHTFDRLPGYRQLRYVPGISNLPKQTTRRLTKDLSKHAYQSLVRIWEDPEIAEITTQLAQSFRDTLAAELQKKHNTQEIEELLIDMLEEIKINYIREIAEAKIEQIVDEAEQFHRRVKT